MTRYQQWNIAQAAVFHDVFHKAPGLDWLTAWNLMLRRVGRYKVFAAHARRNQAAMKHLARRARRRRRRATKAIDRQIAREGLIPTLCRLVREAGLTMTLYGHPISGPDELRDLALVSALERLGGSP